MTIVMQAASVVSTLRFYSMRRLLSIAVAAATAAVLVLSAAFAKEPAGQLKAGIIGLDTSHVVAFTGLLNRPDAKGVLAEVRIVAAYPGGSPDLPDSANRVGGYTKDLREKYGVEIVDSI